MNNTCTQEGCDRKHYTKGLCRSHYYHLYRKLGYRRSCTIEGCTRKHHAKDLCAKHYYRACRSELNKRYRQENLEQVRAREAGYRAPRKRWILNKQTIRLQISRLKKQIQKLKECESCYRLKYCDGKVEFGKYLMGRCPPVKEESRIMPQLLRNVNKKLLGKVNDNRIHDMNLLLDDMVDGKGLRGHR